MEGFRPISIHSLPHSMSTHTYLITIMKDLDTMSLFLRRYLRYNHCYIGPIYVKDFVDNYSRPINGDCISNYYVLHEDDGYGLYYRILTNTNSLEDCYRHMIYKKCVDFKLGNSFKEFEHYFRTVEEGERYMDNMLHTNSTKIKKSVRRIYYDNITYNGDKCIFMLRNYLNSGRILYFDSNIWDVEMIDSII